MRSFILRSIRGAAKPASQDATASAVARRDLFSGAFGISAIAASIAFAKAESPTPLNAAMPQTATIADQADQRPILLGLVRGALAHNARENG